MDAQGLLAPRLRCVAPYSLPPCDFVCLQDWRCLCSALPRNQQANEEWCKIWSEFKESVHGSEPVLLTLDSVYAQTVHSFKSTMEQCATYPMHGPCNATHVWQAIDRHIGKTFKDLYMEEQMDWLGDPDHFEGYHKLTASERRVLVTHWIGDARARYLATKVKQHTNCCRASGLLLGLDGSGHPSVESNPLFVLQEYREWEGLREALDGSWKQPAAAEPAPGSPSSTSSSSSSTSDDSSESEDSLPPQQDGADDEAAQADEVGPAAASAGIPEAGPAEAGEDGSDDWMHSYCSVADLVDMLKVAQKRQKERSGLRMLTSFAKEGTPLSHPARLKGSGVRLSTVAQAAQELGLEMPG